jgi:hypothetical protein
MQHFYKEVPYLQKEANSFFVGIMILMFIYEKQIKSRAWSHK